MNNIFKIIWNKTTQRIEVVSELAKGAVKASSGSHQSKSIAIKSTLKLSLVSLCLGYVNNGSAAVGSENGVIKYGDYGLAIGGYAGGAQVGPKPKEGNRVAAVGNRQISIGHDKLVASGNNSIVIGTDYGHANAWGLTYRQGGTQGFNTVGIGAGAQSIGLNALALGAASGSGVGYQGYDDAVYLGSFSRITPKGLGQNYTDADINTLNNSYTKAVEAFNQDSSKNTLNAVKEAGRKINNAALNKVDTMTIKYNVDENSQLNPTRQDIEPLNASKDKTTVSILSIGGENGDNKMYRQIQNVAAGRMSADSFDAVNGSQLYYVRNYTGWNIGHNSNNQETVTGRVNNDHTVIFKAKDNYVNVSTTLDSTNKSTVNIGVNTSGISVTEKDGRITAVTPDNPANTVATTTSVKKALETFDKVKADKVDIMGYSHVNKTDADKVTENRIITAKNWDSQFDNNSGTYHESAGAKGNRAITSGVRANALANDSIAIGSLANVNNNWGSQSVAAERSIAIGREATVNAGKDSIAMGSGAQILHSDPTTLNANNSIAIGKLSKIDQASNAIALGNNASISGADGSTGVWKGSDNSIAIGNNSAVKRENSVAIGTNVTVERENSVVIGQNASATKERVVAIGAFAKADGDRTVAIGPEATASASKSIVIGGLGDNATDNKAQSDKGADQAIVIGNGAQAKAAASYSITLGNSAKTEAVTGISIGDRANVASGANSGIALGKSAVANKSGDIAIGESSSTSDKHTVSGLKIGDATLSTGVAATGNGTVSFGNNTIKRQIQNVGAGEISDTSSDVITGSQLYHVIKAADEIAKTEYKFQVNGADIKTMSNKGTSAVNNANNVLNFKAGDGLDVAYENNAVTYKLNADSKNSIIEAKNAAQTVTTSLEQINKSVKRAETAATAASTSASAASSSATAASTSASAASTSASAASSSATAASTSASAASSSATAASTSASAASSSATAASTSASAASSSATAAS
ncbi:ESPR-type extended signal peptide-containing protein, partial [Haemophilus haemolyticus]|uniref:ESPR-type extended signal peptide-containing protein n=1 Tax=Haemophilus haemolyticus TaxID=726 RepID=UPI00069C3AEC